MYGMQEGEAGREGRVWGLRNMPHLGFLTFIRNCSLNLLFICLAEHFPAPFLVVSLSIMMYHVCICIPRPTPSSVLHSPVHPPPASPHPSLQYCPWVSPCLLHSCQVDLLPAELGCRMDPLLPVAACLEQSGPKAAGSDC